MGRKTLMLLATVLLAVLPLPARADGPGRIYTKPVAGDTGVITAKVTGAELTHAIAVERDRTRVFLGTLDAAGTTIRFENLPVGRYDLVLVTKDKRLIEGLALGAAVDLPADRAAHLAAGVAKADTFFNRHKQHRAGVEGGVALVLVERVRDSTILRGSGEQLDANLRRFEIIELRAADDEWQMARTRHLFRGEFPRAKDETYFVHSYLPALGGLRVTAAPRDLGNIDLTPAKQP